MKKQGGCQVNWYTWPDLEVQWKIIALHIFHHDFVHLIFSMMCPFTPQLCTIQRSPQKECVKNSGLEHT